MAAKRIYFSEKKKAVRFLPDNLSTKRWKPREKILWRI